MPDSADPAVVDMANCIIGVGELEFILKVVRDCGHVEIRNCGGVMSMIELGSYLRSLEA